MSQFLLKEGQGLQALPKMNFVSLVLHGLGAISVHSNTVAVRIFIASSILMLTSFLGIFIVLCIKYFTHLAIPGWVSNVLLGLAILLVQSFTISLFLIFVVLNHRGQRLFIPALDYKELVNRSF